MQWQNHSFFKVVADSNFGLNFQKIKIDILKSFSLLGIFCYKE